MKCPTLTAMKKGIEIQVLGKVQGVWFRASTQLQAQMHQLTGWVRNEPDGTVLIRAFGEEKDLQEFKAWCNLGPPHASVIKILIKEIDFQDFKSFEILRK